MERKEQLHNEKLDIKDHDKESSFEDSIGSCLSSCSSDLMEDATSSSSSNSSLSSNGPLFELSDLMAHLPIKRGLSKFYHGKSQTFTSLASVNSLQDLAKRKRPTKRISKSCDHLLSPKPIISKKNISRASLLSSQKISRSGNGFTGFRIS